MNSHVTLACALFLLCAVVYRAIQPIPSLDRPRKPPVHVPSIPYVGHMLRMIREGSNPYLSSLCASQQSPMATMGVLGQEMHLINPLDRDSIKKFAAMRDLSLMEAFYVTVGRAMNVMPSSEKVLTTPDNSAFKRDLSKLFNEELRSLSNLRCRAADMLRAVEQHWAETIPHQGKPQVEVGLGSWLFDTLSRSMGSVFWGDKGPFEDGVFRQSLRLFLRNVEALSNPLAFLISRQAVSHREYVRNALGKAVEDEAYEADSQGPTLFRRLALLYEKLDIPREAYIDLQLEAIVGLMSNVINLLTWAFCHIIADQELMASIVKELTNAPLGRTSDAASPNAQAEPDLLIDNDQIREYCPLLMATWYEMLRLYADVPVARSVQKDCHFGPYQLKKGSMIVIPVHLHNFSQGIWGPDVESARPQRFVQDGRLDRGLIRHLDVFGLPGLIQCPGRYLSMNLALGILAKALLAFDMAPAEGGCLFGGVVPKRKQTMLGVDTVDGDPRVTVRRRSGVRSVQVGCSNIRPGW